ncbi:MAG: methylmalonyl Co-A mutase-associated GTPase MeaB [Symbiobacteriia bacterium]
MELLERFLAGNQRALARVITLVENDAPERPELLAELHPRTGRAHVIGITGAPGVGKSTLVDMLSAEARRRGRTVGIIAVDPSSPFSGGAVLGDRIRMQHGAADRGVFIRSLSARGHAGGISAATGDVVSILDAFGFDLVLVETVGAGQSEVDVMRLAQTTLVVTIPGLGDDIQAIKAGILEIGDLFVVNKADRDGADRTVMELEMMLDLGESHEQFSHRWDAAGHHGTPPVGSLSAGHAAGRASDAGEAPGSEAAVAGDAPTASLYWRPPVLKTVARDGTGLVELMDQLEAHLAYLRESGRWRVRQLQEAQDKLRQLVLERLLARILGPAEASGDLARLAEAVANRTRDPFSAASELLRAYWSESEEKR